MIPDLNKQVNRVREWKVCIVTEYKDWEGFLASNKRYDEIFEKMQPDQANRDEMDKKWEVFLDNHTVTIVMDNPRLQK
jgi:hypothetical protein